MPWSVSLGPAESWKVSVGCRSAQGSRASSTPDDWQMAQEAAGSPSPCSWFLSKCPEGLHVQARGHGWGAVRSLQGSGSSRLSSGRRETEPAAAFTAAGLSALSLSQSGRAQAALA